MDWHTLISVTEPVATLAPYALLAPFVGLFAGLQVAKLSERAVIKRRLAQATGRYVSHGRREGWWT
jgi:hypothetical protein